MKKIRKIMLLIILIIALTSNLFSYSVFAAENVAQLQIAHDSAETAMNIQSTSPVGDPYYEIDSYQSFTTAITSLGGLVSIQAVIDDVNSLQIDVDTLTADINTAMAYLTLNSTYNLVMTNFLTADSFLLTSYTSSSQLQYNAEMDRIEVILNTPTSGEIVIGGLNTDISNASNLLVALGDTTDLEAAYNNAIGKDISVYTPNSQIDYQTELDRINAVILSDDTSQPETDQALLDVQTALDLLILQANRTNLNALNSLLIKAYYEEAQLYTTSSHNAFKTLCDAFGSYLGVNSLIVNDNATQAQVDTMEANIQAAFDLLVLLADNTGLLVVYYEFMDSDLSIYTTNSQTDYNNELDRLYEIITGDELDSNTVEIVLFELSELNSFLVELPDYTQLQFAYDSVTVYREEDYSVSSYSIFTSAVTYADYMLTNKNATQEEIDSTIVLLNDSIESLVQTIEPIYIREKNSIDITQYITLGQSQIESYVLGDTNIISVDSNGIVKGLNYGETDITVILSNGAEEIILINVTAGIKTSVYVMAFSIPLVTLGIGSIVLFGRKEVAIKLFANIRNGLKRKPKK